MAEEKLEEEAAEKSEEDVDEEKMEVETDGMSIMKWTNSFLVLLKRQMLVVLRNPDLLKTQVIAAMTRGLLLGAVYWNVYGKSTSTFIILDTQVWCCQSLANPPYRMSAFRPPIPEERPEICCLRVHLPIHLLSSGDIQ